MLEEEKNENVQDTQEETTVEVTEVAEEVVAEEAPKKKVLRASKAGKGERKSQDIH